MKWFEPKVACPADSECALRRLIHPEDRDSLAECLYSRAAEAEEAGSAKCVDLYFKVAVETSSHDGPDSETCRQRTLHKSALIKLVSAGQRFRRLDPERGLLLCCPEGERWITLSRNGFFWQPEDFHIFKPVGDYRVKVLRNRYRCPGLGIPLVVRGCRANDNDRLLPKESTFCATLVMSTEHGEPQLDLYDPLRVKTATHCGREKRIARDLSASIAYRLSIQQTSVVTSFISPGGPSSSDGLRVVEPYQKGKVPVVLIHGLLSNPFTWAQMVNELRVVPGFLDRFQLWIFQYPTGLSFVESANQLRKQLVDARLAFDPTHQDPQFANMVLIGHSMGGLIAKLQITSSGDQLWDSVANRPIGQVRMPERVRQDLNESFFFNPSADVSRVIFISTPHRGSGFATRFIGRVGSSLVRPDQRDRRDHDNLINCNPGVFSKEVSKRIPTSIDLLEPGSKLLQAAAVLPVPCRIKMHSIIGDKCGTWLCGKSDGVVPVSSAREPRSVSELIVNATHTKSKDHPKAIKEVVSILETHWQQTMPATVKQAVLELADLRRLPRVNVQP